MGNLLYITKHGVLLIQIFVSVLFLKFSPTQTTEMDANAVISSKDFTALKQQFGALEKRQVSTETDINQLNSCYGNLVQMIGWNTEMGKKLDQLLVFNDGMQRVKGENDDVIIELKHEIQLLKQNIEGVKNVQQDINHDLILIQTLHSNDNQTLNEKIRVTENNFYRLERKYSAFSENQQTEISNFQSNVSERIRELKEYVEVRMNNIEIIHAQDNITLTELLAGGNVQHQENLDKQLNSSLPTEPGSTEVERLKGDQRVTVAVYEHNMTHPPSTDIPVSRSVAVQHMMVNLKIIQKQAERASAQGAKLLVLPEYGISGFVFKRNTIYPYLEEIPDPKQTTSVPCRESNISGNDVQLFLSCLALNTSMYIVANMGDRQPCNIATDAHCPTDGHYQYNTNVVFSPEGKLIARYHKYNLYGEFQFDVPRVPEPVTFDTPFGRFGTLICFDILFPDPAITLLKNQGVRNIVFPTAWFDALPFFSAIGFHSAFAAKWQINMLAANVHYPKFRAQGSGIYAADGSGVFAYDSKTPFGHLLVSSIPILQHETLAENELPSSTTVPIQLQDASKYAPEFQSRVFRDLYNLVEITGNNGNKTVCQNDTCCHVSYSRSENSAELYAFGAFDGFHHGRYRSYYLQICIILKCGTLDHSSCGERIKDSNTNFSFLEITSSSTGYIYPEVILSNNGQLALSKKWGLEQRNVLSVKEDLEYPLLSASLVSRMYSRD